ncbi:MAG TPA: DNA-deoxyinosine glycosylase, partial [Brevundimonas sp.]|nr:DNA-deoxyinosine glycosylase [Brevundimonas sp.]
AEAADLRRLIAGLPALRAVAFNGGTAAKIGRRSLEGMEGLALIDLPSSSPAYTLARDEKARRWAVLGSWTGKA